MVDICSLKNAKQTNKKAWKPLWRARKQLVNGRCCYLGETEVNIKE